MKRIKNTVASIMLAGATVPASVEQLFNGMMMDALPKFADQQENSVQTMNPATLIWMSPINKNGTNYHVSSNQSETPPDPNLLNNSCTFYFSFLTKMEPNSWCSVVLKEPTYVESVYIKNRKDGYGPQIVGSKIEISLDGINWIIIQTYKKQ